MKKIVNPISLLSLLLVVLAPLMQCRQAYVSPYVSPPTGYLVVEGYISGNGPVSYTLSRVAQLSADATLVYESGALVQVEGNDSSVYPLTGQGNGLYGSAGILPLNASTQYRLRITTASGGKYLSDYAPYKITPPIDSINFAENGNGVTIYANAHNDAGTTRYYEWSYDETWEYHSAEESKYVYFSDTVTPSVLPRDSTDQVYTCWHNGSSTNILVSTTDKLSHDVVYEYPLRQIPLNSVPLSVGYSILVRQYALTEDGYDFLSLMQKNTQTLGTIFDAQPSELTGNIHCLTNPNESVIGFVSAGTVQQQRIFISRSDIPDWHYVYECQFIDTLIQPFDYGTYFGTGDYTPIEGKASGLGFSGYYSNQSYCINCILQGGLTAKPPFWPN